MRGPIGPAFSRALEGLEGRAPSEAAMRAARCCSSSTKRSSWPWSSFLVVAGSCLAKILLQRLVEALDLAAGLGVVGPRVLRLDAEAKQLDLHGADRRRPSAW